MRCGYFLLCPIASVHCPRRSLANQLPCFILIEEDLTIPQLGPRCKKMHGRRRSSTFHHELTLCATLHVCRARDSGSRAKDYQRLCFCWVYKADVGRLDERLLACGWTACGRDIDNLFLSLSRLLQGHPQTPTTREVSGDLVPADPRLSVHIHHRANAKMAIRFPIQA
jgi:hypothetical protein